MLIQPPAALVGSIWFWQGLGAGPCSEVFAPGEQPEMADKSCLCGNDFSSLTRSIPVPCSVSENSCITHLAKKDCKSQLALSVLVSRDSLCPYPGNIPACAAHTGSTGKSSMHGHKNCILCSQQSFLGMSGFRGGVIWHHCADPQGTPLELQGSEHQMGHLLPAHHSPGVF